jgi:predicted glycosyltransferase
VARDYGETVPLLEEMGIEHYIYSTPSSSKAGKVTSIPADVVRATRWLKNFDIGLITGFGSYDTYASTLMGVPNLIFNDSEFTISRLYYILEFKLVMPFVDHIITPSYFRQDLGRKQLRVNSLKEMAYLHPSYYTPDEGVLDLLSVSKGEPYSILRFNAFDAIHDKGVWGFDDASKRELVKRLQEHSQVFISSEKGVPPELRSNVIDIPRSRIHDALYYARLLVTDTQTMATEGAILGTPTVRCNSFVGPGDMGNFLELEGKYGLIVNLSDRGRAIDRAVELVQDAGAKEEWGRRRSHLLDDYVDITAMMTWLIEDYPRNMERLIADPDTQAGFRFKSPRPLI